MRKSKPILMSTLLFIGAITLSGCVTGTRFNLTNYDRICDSISATKEDYKNCVFKQQELVEQQLDDILNKASNMAGSKEHK